MNQKQLKNEIEETSQIKTFKYVENQEFKGIFNYLTKSSNGNIHEKGIINITSNYINSNHPKNLLDFNENNYYSGKFKQDCRACFDFKDKEIEISHYSIKLAVSPGYLKNWVIKISSNGNEWTTIHSMSNYSGLEGNNLIKAFQTEPNHFARYFRFRNTGDFWECENYYLRIGCIEFYGRLKEC